MGATTVDGEHFGPYRLLRRLGQGGMGEVWAAFDTRRERHVALKRIAGRLAADPVFAERFRREARLTARLSSPRIIPIHDFGEIDGTLFLDMRLVVGTDLARILDDGPLPEPRALDVAGQIASALDAAHGAGLLHRDVKPSNVLVETDARGADSCYLVDFGIAKLVGETGTGTGLTGSGVLIGTLAYLAPELIAGADASPRSDVYAFGAVLFEMLAGTRPFAEREPAALLYQHVHQPPPRPSALRAGLERYDDVLGAALAKDPAQRPASAGELVDALAGTGPRAPRPAAMAWPPVRADALTAPRRRPSDTPTAAPIAESPPLANLAPGRPRRTRRLVVAVVVALLVVAAGVVTVVTTTRTDRVPATAAPAAPTAPPATPTAVPGTGATITAVPTPTAPGPTSVGGVLVPFGLNVSGAPVRRFTPRGGSLTLAADHSLDLDSTAAGWGVAPIAAQDAAQPGGPGSEVGVGKYDVFFRDQGAGGEQWLEGSRVSSAMVDVSAFGPNYDTCHATMTRAFGVETSDIIVSPGDSFCVQSDQGRVGVVRVVDKAPDRLKLDVVVWEPVT